MFKKKTLKFQYEKVSRDMRHAEAVEARESSRFERLSTLRSMNESDFKENSMETPKESMLKAPECKKPSRLEMLFKWKQEKLIKKEIEKVAKKKPFYTGGNKNVVENKSLKSSFSAQSNSSSFNSSKFTKSRLVTPNPIVVQPSRILNAKQGTPGATIQSKIPNSKQGTPTSTFQSSRIPNSKQGASTITSQLPKIAVSKQNNLPKSGNNLSRSNSTATLSRKFPVVTTSSSVNKIGSSLSRSNSTVATTKKLPIFSSAINKDGNKAVLSKAVNNTKKGPLLNRMPNNVPSCTNNKSNISKPVYKVPTETKFVSKCQKENPAKKVGAGLAKLTSNIATVPKGIPVQNKLPVPNVNKKLNPKNEFQPNENISSRKGYCFRTAIANSTHQRTDTLLKTPMQGTPKKPAGKTLKSVEKKPSTKELSEQSLDFIPDVTFNSDISIIKPARTSFAPVNFTFQPPEGLNNFIFDDDDDCDIYQTIEEIKQKFMSRTSTPSKDSGRKSSISSSKESLGSNNLKAEKNKVSDLSNSNDIHISELMTPVSFKVKTVIEETDETSTKETSNKVVCDIIINIENNDSDISISQQACDEIASVSPIKTPFKEIVVIASHKNEELIFNSPVRIATEELRTPANQEACKELFFTSPIKTSLKEIDVVANHKNEELIFNSPVRITAEELRTPANQEACEELISTSSTKTDINTDKTINQQISEEIIFNIVKDLSKTETAEGKADSELQKSLHDEKKLLLDDSDKTENPKENTVKISSNEINFNPSLKDGSPESEVKETLFFDDDDDFLLDSIDLNRIQLMKLDDDDTDEDNVPSPQILKCPERKSNGAVPKRVSILKKLSVMNSIAESIETDEHAFLNLAKSSQNNQSTKNTPRRSKRISTLLSVDTLCDSPLKNIADTPKVTPRRSLRLMKANSVFSVSPFQEKNASNIGVRRSMRLIDLNTPEKAACEKVLGENLENLDPNNFLIDFESPTMPALPKSKKVSLLYTPEKRKSLRKSIRGDLMSFSPI